MSNKFILSMITISFMSLNASDLRSYSHNNDAHFIETNDLSNSYRAMPFLKNMNKFIDASYRINREIFNKYEYDIEDVIKNIIVDDIVPYVRDSIYINKFIIFNNGLNVVFDDFKNYCIGIDKLYRTILDPLEIILKSEDELAPRIIYIDDKLYRSPEGIHKSQALQELYNMMDVRDLL